MGRCLPGFSRIKDACFDEIRFWSSVLFSRLSLNLCTELFALENLAKSLPEDAEKQIDGILLLELKMTCKLVEN
jgi:hypothetical protein